MYATEMSNSNNCRIGLWLMSPVNSLLLTLFTPTLVILFTTDSTQSELLSFGTDTVLRCWLLAVGIVYMLWLVSFTHWLVTGCDLTRTLHFLFFVIFAFVIFIMVTGSVIGPFFIDLRGHHTQVIWIVVATFCVPVLTTAVFLTGRNTVLELQLRDDERRVLINDSESIANYSQYSYTV